MTSPERTDPPDQPEPQAQPAAQPDAQAEPEWRRKRRLAEVFGDGLPDTTADERDPQDGSAGLVDRGEAWLREQVPPHHG